LTGVVVATTGPGTDNQSCLRAAANPAIGCATLCASPISTATRTAPLLRGDRLVSNSATLINVEVSEQCPSSIQRADDDAFI